MKGGSIYSLSAKGGRSEGVHGPRARVAARRQGRKFRAPEVPGRVRPNQRDGVVELCWHPGAGRSGQAGSSGRRKVRGGIRLTRELARLGWSESSEAGSSGSAGRSGGRKFRALAGSSGLSRELTPVSSSSPSSRPSSSSSCPYSLASPLYLSMHKVSI